MNLFFIPKQRTLGKLLVICLLLFMAAQLHAQDVHQQLRDIVGSIYAKNPAGIGYMVHVEAPDQGLSISYAAGYANKKNKQKLFPDQPLLISSNTKPYVAATILRLTEEGKIYLEQPIKSLLKSDTEKLLSASGYRTDSITLRHLLSHTSGIRDYVDETYFKLIVEKPAYAWTRDEQIARSAGLGGPIWKSGKDFKYADINYILLTELIEQLTNKPFYRAMRSLVGYKKLKLESTWFAKLEKAPSKVLPSAHQYWNEFGWDTYDLDPSWDLYGGGGMKATLKDMALFFQYLFNGKVIQDKNILALMYQDVAPNLDINYCLGIRKVKYSGISGYNHGGV